jgi:hypothetical protein
MKRQHRIRQQYLNRSKSMQTLHGFGYGLSVSEVVLVALMEGLHELGRDQLHVMA